MRLLVLRVGLNRGSLHAGPAMGFCCVLLLAFAPVVFVFLTFWCVERSILSVFCAGDARRTEI